MNARTVGLLVVLCLSLTGTVSAQDSRKLLLKPAARIGIIDLMTTDITHYHLAKAPTGSFMRTYRVNWPLDAQIERPLNEMLAVAGFTPVVLPPSDTLRRNREDWFVQSGRGNKLNKNCAAELARIAAAEHLDSLIVIVAGANSAPEAVEGNRLRQLPDYIQGWGFSTEEPPGDSKPVIFNLSQLLLVELTEDGARLFYREWGGRYVYEWPSFTAPPDLRAMPDAQIEKLQPLLADVTSRQITRLLEHIGTAQ